MNPYTRPMPASEVERITDQARRRANGDPDLTQKLVLAYMAGRREAEQNMRSDWRT